MNSQLPIKKSNKGAISVYFLMLLLIVLNCCGQLVNSINNSLYYYGNLNNFRLLNNIEILVIGRLKYEFRNYREVSETLKYEGCIIQIEVEGTKATFTINSLTDYRERTVVYDSETDTFSLYY